MKIKKLEIRNIASIVDATIDFDAAPLAGADVFLITGDTGAGKSTILDCICLALFNTAPRLKGTLMEGRIDETSNPGGLALSDPRQLLRRNTGAGSVALTFEGNNGREYVATWSVQRAYGKPGRRIQDVVRTLACAGRTVAKGDMQAEMAEAVGMTYDQFCRTTMLAQGEFTRFLNSKDKDKADILEQILNVDIYKDISQAIHERFSNEKSALTRLFDEQGAIAPLSPEALAELHESIAATEKEASALRLAVEVDKKAAEWFAVGARLAADAEAAQRALSDARGTLATRRYADAKAVVSDLVTGAEAIAALTELRTMRRQRRGLRDARRAMRSDFETLCGGMAYLVRQLSYNQRNNRELSAWFDSREDYAPCVEKRPAIESLIRNWLNINKEIERNQKGAEEFAKRAQGLRDESKLCADALRAATDALNESRQAVERGDAELKAAKLHELRRRHGGATERLAKLRLAKAQAKAIAEGNAAIAAMRAKLEQLDASRPQKAALAAEKAAEVQVAKRMLQTLETTLKKASGSLSDWSRRLRAELAVGDMCPVCLRRIDEAFASDDEIEASLAPMRAEMDAQRAALQHATEAMNKAAVELSTLDNRRTDLRAEMETKQTDVADKTKAFAQSCRADAIDSDTIDEALAECNAIIAGLAPAIAEAEKKEAALARLRAEAEICQNAKDAADKRNAAARDALNDCLAAIEAKQVLLASERRQRAGIADELEAAVTGRWENSWRDEPEAFMAELSKLADEWVTKKESQRRLGLEGEKLSSVLSACKGHAEAIERRLAFWRVENAELRPVGGCDAKFAALAARIDDNFASEQALNQQIHDGYTALQQYLVANGSLDLRRLLALCDIDRREVESMRKFVDDAEKGVAAAEKVLAEVSVRMKEHAAARPVMAEGDDAQAVAARLAKNDAELARCQRQLGVLAERLDNDNKLRRRQADLLDKIEARKEVFGKWERLEAMFGSADGRKFSKIALRYVLGHLLDKANVYLARIMPRYTLCCRPDNLVIMVADAYQNGAMRAANVISGGESFVVSLALALALADIGRRFMVDILFIDEGFGTLGGEALGSAVDTLRSLHSGDGRRVGIISHVAELRDRIPAKIVVSRHGGASAATVTVE